MVKVNHSRCKVCQHAERGRIELLAVGGASVRSLSRKFGVSYHSIWRHIQGHLDADRRASLIAGPHKQVELGEAAAEQGLSLIDHMRSVRAGLFRLFDCAVSANDFSNATAVSKALSENAMTLGRLSGELRDAAPSPSPNSGVSLPLDISSMSTQDRQKKMAAMIAVALARLSPEQRAAIEASQGDAAPSPAPAPAA